MKCLLYNKTSAFKVKTIEQIYFVLGYSGRIFVSQTMLQTLDYQLGQTPLFKMKNKRSHLQYLQSRVAY